MDGGDLETFAEAIAEVAHWADAVNATDNTAARAHASNVAVAIALLRCGAEPVLQVVCRDKNRLACQADIVGAALHGVENVCCLTGDDVTAGDEPEARRVFDLDGPQLVSVASRLAARPLPVRPPDRAGAAPLHRSGREPGRAPVRLPARRAPGRRSRPARGSCSFRSATTRTGSRRSSPRSSARG